MFNGLRRLFDPLEETASGYQPIAAEERDAETAALTPPVSTGSGRKIYLSFWVLGAAVLLPWNGEAALECCADSSVHVYIPIMDVALSCWLYARQSA